MAIKPHHQSPFINALTAGWAGRFLGSVEAPVDIASLAVFRMLFGLLMAFALARSLAHGWVDELYVEPTYFFSYGLFEWLKPLPSVGMHVLFVALATLALCVAAGFCYRLAVGLFFLGFTYIELIDKTTYLNHYYLVSLLGGLLIFLPAHRAFSFDAWRNQGGTQAFI